MWNYFSPIKQKGSQTVKLLKSQRVKSLVSNSKVSEVILKFPSLLALMEGQTSKPRLQLGSLVDDHPGACMVPVPSISHILMLSVASKSSRAGPST